MKYVFLGGASEVGASCLLLSVGEKNILIDTGVRVNQGGNASLPDFKKLKEMARTLDAIFISHAHSDHVGALPLVYQMFPHTPIYATLPTQRLSAGVSFLRFAIEILLSMRFLLYHNLVLESGPVFRWEDKVRFF